MASGKVHDQSIVVTAFIIPPVMDYYKFGNIKDIAIFTALYIVTGLFLSPDIDTRSVVYYRYWFLRFFWKPYQRLFPHRGSFFHRNFYTHFPVVATLIRLGYFLAIPVLVLRLNDFTDWQSLLQPLLLLYVATELSSFTHLIFDIIYTKRH